MADRTKAVLILAATIMLAIQSATGWAAVVRQYACGPFGDKRALVLPVPDTDGSTVNVQLHGRQVPATYQVSGLTQLWFFEDGLYVELRPGTAGFNALYMDFRGAEPGETRKPTATFFCE